MGKPTEDAEYFFENARVTLGRLLLKSPAEADATYLAAALGNMAWGLKHLSVGLRATYIELQEVKRLLQQQKR